ncbi:MAG: hypothetical protein JKY48_04665, partial [Flavobacteriales bacterium]|nr:hypothetical protein [Flavobacteriales bacterium]
DSTGIDALGFVAGPHTIDTDTQLDSTGIDAFGFTAGPHTIDTDTQLDSLGITNLGFVAGPHTIDIDTQLDSTGIDAFGFTAGPHTIDTDTQLDSLGITTLGFVAGADTQIDSTGIDALGFVAGPHTINTDTQLLRISATRGTLSISNGNSITLSDSSATNELQILSLNTASDMSTISNGNILDISGIRDSSLNDLADTAAVLRALVSSATDDDDFTNSGSFDILTGRNVGIGNSISFSGFTGQQGFASGSSITNSGTNSVAFGSVLNVSGDNSAAIGFRNNATGTRSITIGSWTEATANQAIVIGNGLITGAALLTNNIANSIMMGTNSDTPTLTIYSGNGTAGSIGSVGIGAAPNSNALLYVESTEDKTGYFLQNGSSSAKTAVKGEVIGVGSIAYALEGEATSTATSNYGLHSIATGAGGTNYGVYGKALGATTNWAGYFDNGNVFVNNNLLVNGVSFLDSLRINNAYSFPDADGTANQIFKTDGSGVLSSVDASSIFSGDNLGSHLLDSNIKTNGFYLSNDGDDEGVFVGTDGHVGIDTNDRVSNESLTIRTMDQKFGWMHTNGDVSMGSWIFSDLNLTNKGGGQIGTFSNHKLDFITNNSAARMTIGTNGNVGIGYSAATQHKLYVTSDSINTSSGQTYDMVQFNSNGTATSGAGQNTFAAYSKGTDGTNLAVFGSSTGPSTGINRGLYGFADSATTNHGVYGFAGATPAGTNFAIGVRGSATQISDGINYGVYGNAQGSSFINRGIVGVIGGTVTLSDAAVYGIANGTGQNISIYGRSNVSNVSGSNYGVYAIASNADTNYAVYAAEGNVLINDTLILKTGTPSNGLVLTSDADGKATWQSPSAGTDNQALSINGTGGRISLINGGSVDLNDSSATNEIQTLSLMSGNIELSNGGGSVSLDDADADNTNEAQTISKSGSTVTLTQANGSGGGSYTDSALTGTQVLAFVAADGYIKTEVDGSTSNELQDLTINGSNDSLLLSNGAGVKLSEITVGISDEQNLSISSDSITIDNGRGAYIGDIRDTLTNHNIRINNNASNIADNTGNISSNVTAIGTESSTRQTADGNLSIRIINDSTNLANHITADGDLSATNEIQTISKTGSTVTLTSGGTFTDSTLTETTVDDFVSNNGFLTTEVDGSITNEIQILSVNAAKDSLLISNGMGVKLIDLQSAADTLSIIQSADKNRFVETETAGEVGIGINGSTRLKVLENRVEFAEKTVFIGNAAGSSQSFTPAISDSTANIAIGNQALMSNGVSTGELAIGPQALMNSGSSASNNTAIGAMALKLNDNGTGGTAVGFQSLKNVNGGSNNTAFGSSALVNLTSGASNTALGAGAGSQLTIGADNIFIGNNAGTAGSFSQRLYIDNTNGGSTPLIYGDFAEDSLVFNGVLTIDSMKDGSGYTFPGIDGTVNQILQTDGSGKVNWKTFTGADNLGNHVATQNIQLANFYLSNDGDNEGLSVNSSGEVSVGTATGTSLTVSKATEQLLMEMQSYGSGNSAGTVFDLFNARGNQSSKAAVGSGDRLFTITSRAYYNPTNLVSNELMTMSVDGSVSTNTVPTRTDFNTVAGNGLSNTVLSLRSDGKVGIGNTSPDSTLTVNGGLKSTYFTLTDGASNGYVLTSNASGVASWQLSSGDNLGDHTAIQTMILDSNWISEDGDPEGMMVDVDGKVMLTDGIYLGLAPSNNYVEFVGNNHTRIGADDFMDINSGVYISLTTDGNEILQGKNGTRGMLPRSRRYRRMSRYASSRTYKVPLMVIASAGAVWRTTSVVFVDVAVGLASSGNQLMYPARTFHAPTCSVT